MPHMGVWFSKIFNLFNENGHFDLISQILTEPFEGPAQKQFCRGRFRH